MRRITSFDYESCRVGDNNKGMGAFVRDLNEEFESVEYVYVWVLAGVGLGLMSQI